MEVNQEAIDVAAAQLARMLGLRAFDVRRLLAPVIRRLVESELHALRSAQRTASPPARPDPRGRSPGIVRVPYSGKGTRYNSLRRCINQAATEYGCTGWQVSKILTYVFQAIADEVCFGEVVAIPGFGLFGPYAWREKRSGREVCYPRFVPARSLRTHVANICHPSQGANKKLEAYRRSHHPASRPEKINGSTTAVMERWRASIDKQATYEVRGPSYVPPEKTSHGENGPKLWMRRREGVK